MLQDVFLWRWHNESADSWYLFGVAEGLNERFTAAKTEVSELQLKVWTLFGNHSLRWTALMQPVIWKCIQEMHCCLRSVWRRSTFDMLGCKQVFAKLKMSS